MSFEKKHIIKRMIGLEKGLASLYGIYASLFPETESFWRTVSYEENKHAESLKTFRQMEKEGGLRFSKGRFDPQAIELTVKKIHEQITKAKREYRHKLKNPEQRIPVLRDAVRASVLFESDITERKYYSAFESDSLALKKAFYKIETDSSLHLQKVRELFLKLSR